jgi:ribosomal protein L24E
MKCENCKKEIESGKAIRHSDIFEGTTIHLFCSTKCEKKWVSTKEVIHAT